MCKKIHKIWLHGLWDNYVWSGNKSSFPLCPIGIVGFDRLWGNFFKLCKLDALHHLNAHNVRYLCANFRHRGWVEHTQMTLHWRRVQSKGPNLRSINVSGANMLGANLRGYNVLGANMSGTNMYRAQTCWAPTCIGRQLKGANMHSKGALRVRTCRAPTCTGRQHVRRQHALGANLRAPT
jgi:uncharacterized protein YjbI with pentapeptide repeats